MATRLTWGGPIQEIRPGTVNLAQRLERLNKELGTDCLISGATFAAARSACADAAPAGSLRVSGREGNVEAYALRPRAA